MKKRKTAVQPWQLLKRNNYKNNWQVKKRQQRKTAQHGTVKQIYGQMMTTKKRMMEF